MRIIEKSRLKENSLTKINFESIIEFLKNQGLRVGGLGSEFRLISRSEKIIVDLLISHSSLDVYSPREDIYNSFDYSTIGEILYSKNGFAVVSKQKRFLLRVHL